MKHRKTAYHMRRTMLLLCLLTLGMASPAQPRGKGKFSPEEFKAKLEGFITQEAGFTPQEAQAFFPIYHEMKEKQRTLQHKAHELKKGTPREGAPDKDYAAAILEIKALGVKAAQTEESYYKKMCKAVPAGKVYRAMCAEDKFHRQMLEDLGHEGRRQKPSRQGRRE